MALGGVYAQLWAEQTSGVAPTEAPFDAAGRAGAHPAVRRPRRPAARPTWPADSGASISPPAAPCAEGGGRLIVIRRGRGSVLAPDFTGELAPLAEVGSGDAFGLAALLGEEKGHVLRAIDALSLLVLDDEAVRGLAAAHPSVATALEGGGATAAAPAGGTRLSRLTIAPGSRLSLVLAEASAPAPPSAEDVRRMTGSMPAVKQ